MFCKKSNTQEKSELKALQASQAVIHFTPDGFILDANDNFLRVMGYTLDEIKGQHNSIFCEPSYAQSEEYKQFWLKLSAGEFQTGQFNRIGKNNNKIYLEASYCPILDSAGKVIKVAKYATDITTQKLMYADYEGQLAAIGRSQAVIQFNMDGTIITANENFLKVVGYELDEIKGKHHSMFACPSYAKSDDYKSFWEQLNKGEYCLAEFKRLDKGGKEVWIQASYNPILDMNGKSFKVVKYATDITATKINNIHAQAQIDAIDKSQAVIHFEPSGHILYANKNFLDAMGYTLDEIKGKHHQMFVSEEYSKSSEYREFWNKLNSGECINSAFKRLHKNGTEVWIKATYNPIFDLNKKVSKIIKYASDLSELIKIEKLAKESSNNAQSTSAAIEEMTASIGEISNNMQMSKEATIIIKGHSSESSIAAEQLTTSMKSMENIVQMINNTISRI